MIPAGAPVLVVTTSYPRHPDDFAGSFVRQRVGQLLAAGPVEVIAAGEPDGPDPLMSAPGLRVRRVGYAVGGQAALFYDDGAPEALERSPAAWLQAMKLWGGLLPALRAAHISSPLGAVESHWLLPSALAVAAAGLRLPHRAMAHSGDVALFERLPGGAALLRWLLPRIDTLVFASADLRARLARLAGGAWAARVEAALVIPAGSGTAPLRLTAADRARQRQQRGIAGPLLLAVGRLIPIKGHELLIRAVARLPPAVRPTVVVLGEGSERARLEALARARRVSLRLPGRVSPAEVATWLALADLFVHPARALPSGRTEGAPVAVREALAAGLPVVASDSGGIADLLAAAPGRALLVPPGDLPSLTHWIERYVQETSALHCPDS